MTGTSLARRIARIVRIDLVRAVDGQGVGTVVRGTRVEDVDDVVAAELTVVGDVVVVVAAVVGVEYAAVLV